MAEGEHTSADEKLIKKLFNLNPLDWSRYPDGRLVFIAPTGAKYSYSAKDLEALTASAAKSKPSKPEQENQPQPDPQPEPQPEPEPIPAGARPAEQGADGAPPSPAADAAAPASDLYPQATE